MAHDMGEMSEGVNRTFGGARGKRKKKKKRRRSMHIPTIWNGDERW